MKTLKYPPDSFLEINDGCGGRRVVIVGRDGVTYWDSQAVDAVTPVAIHPVMNPVPLGALMDYVETNKLDKALKALLTRNGSGSGEPSSVVEPLFYMRCLHYLSGKGFVDPAHAQLSEAEEYAAQQHQVALDQHRIVKEVFEQNVQRKAGNED